MRVDIVPWVGNKGGSAYVEFTAGNKQSFINILQQIIFIADLFQPGAVTMKKPFWSPGLTRSKAWGRGNTNPTAAPALLLPNTAVTDGPALMYLVSSN